MSRPRVLITIDKAKAFIARYASAEEAVRRLMIDNFNQREKLRSAGTPDTSEHEREIERLSTELDEVSAKLPKADEVIVKKTDADVLAQYKTLGAFDDVKKKVEKSTELQGELDGKKADETTDAAADLLGYSKSVLRDLVRSRGLTIENRDVTVDNKTVKAPYVKQKDKTEFEPLKAFAERDLKDYLPALTAKPANGQQQQQQTGVQFPVLTPDSGKTVTGDAADQFLAKRNERAGARPNPLAPPAAAAKSAA